MEQRLKKVLQYFSFFNYHPAFDEIYTFFPVKISKKNLKTIIEAKKYTVGEYAIRGKKSKIKYKISKIKLKNWRFKTYVKILSIFPQIKLIGLSGSIAMMNNNLDDDIDLFIIASKNHLFTARFLATIFAYIMGLKRRIGQKKAPGKVCLNLFFDENDLRVPKFKQTEYVAHEVLQMKPLVNKDKVYERFLQKNRWVFRLFPNAKSQILNHKSKINSKRLKFKILNLFGIWNLGFRISNKIESILKNLQLSFIRRHQTTEIITDSQLWFHPVDFGKKMKF